MKKIIHILLIFFAVVFYSACEYEFIKPLDPGIDPNEPQSFSADILPIFEAQDCITCHSSTGTQFSLETGSAYQNILNMNLADTDNPEQSILYTVPDPTNPDQHPTTYTTEQAARVLIWIEQGALNN